MAHTPLTRNKRILRHFEEYCEAYLWSAFLVAMIAAGIWWVARNDARIREMASWPTTDALIVSSKVDERPIADDHHLLTELRIEVHVQFDHDGVAREASFSEAFHRGSPLDYVAKPLTNLRSGGGVTPWNSLRRPQQVIGNGKLFITFCKYTYR